MAPTNGIVTHVMSVARVRSVTRWHRLIVSLRIERCACYECYALAPADGIVMHVMSVARLVSVTCRMLLFHTGY